MYEKSKALYSPHHHHRHHLNWGGRKKSKKDEDKIKFKRNSLTASTDKGRRLSMKAQERGKRQKSRRNTFLLGNL